MRKIKPYMRKMISDLTKLGINFSFDMQMTKKTKLDGSVYEKRLENVIFEKDGVEYKIYEGVIFRDFGQSMYFVQIKGDDVLVELDDRVFYATQRILILNYFKTK